MDYAVVTRNRVKRMDGRIFSRESEGMHDHYVVEEIESR